MIQFANPAGVWLLLVFPLLLAVFFAARILQNKRRERWGGAERISRLAVLPAPELEVPRNLALWGALLLVLLAFARPQWGEVVSNIRRVGLDVILAVDTSRSMLVEDSLPNRLERARLELRSILEADQEDRFGLVAFAGVPVTLSPLTRDGAAVSMLLDIADEDLIPAPGTDLGQAVAECVNLLPPGGEADKVIICFTDGEDHGATAFNAARDAAQGGARLFIVGTGSEEGGVVPGPDGAPMTDPETGGEAHSRMDPSGLKRLAEETDGRFWILEGSGSVVPEILEEMGRLKRREYASRAKTTRQDQYAFFLIPAVILLLLHLALPGRKVGAP